MAVEKCNICRREEGFYCRTRQGGGKITIFSHGSVTRTESSIEECSNRNKLGIEFRLMQLMKDRITEGSFPHGWFVNGRRLRRIAEDTWEFD